MTQKFYVNPDGSYCGSLIDITPAQAAEAKYLQAIEVPTPPPSGDSRQIYDLNNHMWLPLPQVPYQISKTTPWHRMTDAEAEMIYGLMEITSPKLRGIYDAATFLSSGDPLWLDLLDMLTSVVGATRAAELLAPEV